MKVLSVIADKNLAGVEDIIIGGGHVTQTRLTKDITLHKINICKNLGLLSQIDFDTIDSDITLFRVTGYYTEYDGGEGYYEKINIDFATHDIGLYIVNKEGTIWKRKFQEYVLPEWFGAKGDGETNDTNALLAAIQYGSVLLDSKHYVIDILYSNTILITQSVDLYGINTIIEIKSLLDTAIVTFQLAETCLRVRFRHITFKTNLAKLCQFDYNHNVLFDITHTVTYNPSTSMPVIINNRDYFYIADDQTIGIQTFNTPIRSNKFPTNDNHPVIKAAIKEQELPADTVYLDSDQTLAGQITFTQPVIGVETTIDNGIVTLGQLNNLAVLSDEQKTEIDTWVASLDTTTTTSLPAGSFYLQFKDQLSPAELFPGTESNWVRVQADDVDTFYKVAQIPSDGSLNGTVADGYTDLTEGTYLAVDSEPVSYRSIIINPNTWVTWTIRDIGALIPEGTTDTNNVLITIPTPTSLVLTHVVPNRPNWSAGSSGPFALGYITINEVAYQISIPLSGYTDEVYIEGEITQTALPEASVPITISTDTFSGYLQSSNTIMSGGESSSNIITSSAVTISRAIPYTAEETTETTTEGTTDGSS